MAPGTRRARTLAEQIADLEDPTPKDFDPEAIDEQQGSEDEISGASSDEHDGREHYVDVGKSKLRKREEVALGPQYAGSKVSRDAVMDEESDDPFSKGFDEESSEEDEDEDEDNEADEVNGVASDGEEDSEEEGDEDHVFSDEESDGEGTDVSDQDDDEDEDEDADEDMEKDDGVDRTKLRELLKDEQKTVAATISQAAKADIEKGQAVKAQRATFDKILNSRIRLQKALIATNSFSQTTDDEDNAASDAMLAAENAALNLLNTLSGLRTALHNNRTGSKRTFSEYSADTLSTKIWSDLQTYETETVPHRRAVLEKWSAKTRPTAVISTSNRLNNTAQQQTLTDVLDLQLSDPSRLLKRVRTPRSCAPVQAAAGVAEAEDIYDDADFYGLLLKELLEQRSADLTNTGGTIAPNGISFLPQTPWQAAREAKTKKQVDTRASKGRKLRYTVHEKLQNFMAPEDRGTWGDRQAEELFSGLFGKRVGLGEDEQEDDAKEEADGVDVEEERLTLFRS